MPFLRAALLNKRNKKHSVLSSPLFIDFSSITRLINKKRRDEPRQLTIWEDGTPCSVPEEERWRQYEKFIGGIYEQAGYAVDYNGINKGSKDGGIDLKCTSGEYVVLVQCKYYYNGYVGLKYLYQFHGVCYYYALQHPSYIVSGVFFTPRCTRCHSEFFKIANKLGIVHYRVDY